MNSVPGTSRAIEGRFDWTMIEISLFDMKCRIVLFRRANAKQINFQSHVHTAGTSQDNFTRGCISLRSLQRASRENIQNLNM